MKTYLERQAENQELFQEFIDELEVLQDNAEYYIEFIDEDTTIEDIDEMLWKNDAFIDDDDEEAWNEVRSEVADFLENLDWAYECRSDKEE